MVDDAIALILLLLLLDRCWVFTKLRFLLVTEYKSILFCLLFYTSLHKHIADDDDDEKTEHDDFINI